MILAWLSLKLELFIDVKYFCAAAFQRNVWILAIRFFCSDKYYHIKHFKEIVNMSGMLTVILLNN